MLVGAVHIHLRNTLDGEFLVTEFHLVGIRRIFLGEGHNFVGEGGRKEEDLGRLGNKTTHFLSVCS